MEPESSASMTNTAGPSAGLWSLRKEGPASGYSLDVVVDAEVGQQSFQPLRGAAVAAVLGAVAADDRARPAQVIRLFTIEGVGRV